MPMDTGVGNYCYFKVEAVNIYATIADVDQLSILRGGSALLKESIHFAQNRLRETIQNGEVEAISTGASVGYFRIANINQRTAAQLKIDLEKALSTDSSHRNFTYIVNFVFAASLKDGKETLVALGRLEQQQQLTAPANDLPEKGKTPNISEIGGIRPAWDTVYMQNGVKRYLSKSEACRFKKGKNFRQKFYAEEITSAGLQCPDIDYTSDLQSMAKYPAAGNLDGKIAVIYFDGNQFSTKINKFVSLISEAAEKINQGGSDTDMLLKSVDEYLQGQRRAYLHSLINTYAEHRNDERYFYKAQQKGETKYKARLETLLWGGDEIIFVVPAWLGMEVLQGFYDYSKSWTLNQSTLKNGPVNIDLGKVDSFKEADYNLTHAGGIVFCRAKTPIHKIQGFARNLADNIKEKKGRNANYFDYLVLESVDYPVENSLQNYWQKQYGKVANSRFWLSPASSSEQFSASIHTIQQALPKRQLYSLAKELVSGESFQVATKRLIKSTGEKLFEQANSLLDELIKYDDQILNNFSDVQKNSLNVWKWLHFIELYDYFALLADSNNRS